MQVRAARGREHRLSGAGRARAGRADRPPDRRRHRRLTKWGPLGRLSHVDAGAQGVSAIPGLLEVQTLPRTSNGAAFAATSSGTTALGAVLFEPLIESVALAGDGRGQALARSFAPARQVATLAVPGSGKVRATSFDATGRAAASSRGSGATIAVAIPPGGFAIAER